MVTSLAAVFLAQVPQVADRLGWCPVLPSGHGVPAWLGGAALAITAGMAASSVLAVRRLRTHRSDDGEPLVVLPTDAATAFALPGRPGQVVVSAGMLRRLDADERRVLLAHERAHLRRHHHRYVWIGTLATAVTPPLRPVLARIRFATERWADEDAAREVGDRRLVARAVARAALAQGPAPGMALAGLGVQARVEALVADPPAPHRVAWALVAGGVVAAAGVASVTVQLHHAAEVLVHLCS